jgi:hypothetical protein
MAVCFLKCQVTTVLQIPQRCMCNALFIFYCTYIQCISKFAKKKEDISDASGNVFRETTMTYIIVIHFPRKDQCSLCCGNKVGPISEINCQRHLIKNEAHEAKLLNRRLIHKPVLTMDLQSVLLCPELLVSSLYSDRIVSLQPVFKQNC